MSANPDTLKLSIICLTMALFHPLVLNLMDFHLEPCVLLLRNFLRIFDNFHHFIFSVLSSRIPIILFSV